MSITPTVLTTVQSPFRVFVLSPANMGGARARMLLREDAQFDLARRLRSAGAPIGEVFSFVSGLYFRGKLTYAERFASPPDEAPGITVITAGQGLVRPGNPVTPGDLREIAAVPVDADEARYREPLERDSAILARQLPPGCPVIFLGSVATAKYLDPLLAIFGERLLFPADFPGRGDMSRGGLLLRSARSGEELAYVSAFSAARRGPRPPRLSRL